MKSYDIQREVYLEIFTIFLHYLFCSKSIQWITIPNKIHNNVLWKNDEHQLIYRIAMKLFRNALLYGKSFTAMEYKEMVGEICWLLQEMDQEKDDNNQEIKHADWP